MIALKNYQKLAISILIPILISAIIACFMFNSLEEFYPGMNDPAFQIQKMIIVFLPILFFFLMGMSFYYAWKKDFGKDRIKAITIYFLQLFLNVMWSVFLFVFKAPAVALADSILLWLVVVANVMIFYKISGKAGYLLVPYLSWVSFTTVLDLSFFTSNLGFG
jgi:benzodiazapine receptor